MKMKIALGLILGMFAAQVSGQPIVYVTPDSLVESLLIGDTSVQEITIYNLGTTNLLYSISIEELISAAASTSS